MRYLSPARVGLFAAATALLLAGCGTTVGGGSLPNPTAPVTATPTPSGPRNVTVVMNGDMLLHNGLWYGAQLDAARTGRGPMDFRPLLADLQPVIKGADLAVCHMETPLAPRGGPYKNFPLFSVPPQIAPALKWAGYDACTTASNHSVDQGFEGVVRTLKELRGAGLGATGTATTQAASEQPLVIDAGGVTVGIVSASYGTNGLPLPPGKPWSVNLIDVGKIRAQAALARAEGAEIVLAALHWGNEYQHSPSDYQTELADKITKLADIDLVYGHHAHVVQPFDKVNGTWVLYGLGNAVAQQDAAKDELYDGVTARVTFTEQPDGRFTVGKLEYFPTRITKYAPGTSMRLLDVRRSLADPGKASRHAELRAARERVRREVGALGAFEMGLVAGR